MMRSGNAETRIASCRATRALAARRGDLSRRKIGISAFVEALWALVAPTRAPDLLHVDVSAEVAESNNTDDPGAEPDSEANPETPGDQSAETNSGESHEKKHGRPLPVDPRSRHHALRALITMCSTSWRACDLVVGGAPNTTRGGGGAPAFHRDLTPLVALVRPAKEKGKHAVGAATRLKATRLVVILTRTAHGRAALCHEDGGNLPEALMDAIEEGDGGEDGDTNENSNSTETETADDANASSRDRRKQNTIAKSHITSSYTALLNELAMQRVGDQSIASVAIPMDRIYGRAFEKFHRLFFRAPGCVTRETRIAAGVGLARLVAVFPPFAKALLDDGVLADIKAILPHPDRLKYLPSNGVLDDLFREAFQVGDTKKETKSEQLLEQTNKGNVPLTVSPSEIEFVTTALVLFNALVTHGFVREHLFREEREEENGATWTWTLLHQTMPAAQEEIDELLDEAEGGDDGEAQETRSALVPDALGEGVNETGAEDTEDAASASGESPSRDGETAEKSSDPLPDKPRSTPERFERFQTRELATDTGTRVHETNEASTGQVEQCMDETREQGMDHNTNRTATTDTAATDTDWRSLRARGLSSAFQVPSDGEDVTSTESSLCSETEIVGFVFVPGDPPWNDACVVSAALAALETLARHATCVSHLTRDAGAGAKCVAAVTKQSSNSTRFRDCVPHATRVLACLVEHFESRESCGGRGIDGRNAEDSKETDFLRRALSDVDMTKQSGPLTQILATALASYAVEREVPPTRPQSFEPPPPSAPTPKLQQSRFDATQNLRFALGKTGLAPLQTSSRMGKQSGDRPVEDVPEETGQDNSEVVLEIITVK